MSGHIPPPPPHPVQPPSTSVPPEHELVIDTAHRHTSTNVEVHLTGGQAVVYLESAGTNRPATEAPERSIRKASESDETGGPDGAPR